MIVEHPLGSGAKADQASTPSRVVRGSFVDVRFDKRLPAIDSVLRTEAKKEVVIEVLAQRPQGNAR